jgi:hypothetical protein
MPALPSGLARFYPLKAAKRPSMRFLLHAEVRLVVRNTSLRRQDMPEVEFSVKGLARSARESTDWKILKYDGQKAWCGATHRTTMPSRAATHA